MTSDSDLDGSSASQAAAPTSLNLERIKYFAAMSIDELHENINLKCTEPAFSMNQDDSQTTSLTKDQDDTTMDDIQDLYSTEHIPTIDDNASTLTTDPISSTTNSEIPSTLTALPVSETACPPRFAPTRIFRERRPIQLQPFTEDRKQYHFLIGRKERLAHSGDNTATSSPVPQSFSEYDPSFVDDIPSDGGYSDYDDSDGFVDDLDVDDGGDLSQAISTMNIATTNCDYNDSVTRNKDRDEVNGATVRKKRRIVIADDSDDDLTTDNNNTTAQNSPAPINNTKKKAYDIFAISSDGETEQQITCQRQSTSSGLITYGRRKKPKSQHKGRHKPSNSQNSDINTSISSSHPKPSSSPTRVSGYDVFDIESLDNGRNQQIDKMPKNISGVTNDSDVTLDTHDDIDEDGEDSSQVNTATPSSTSQLSASSTHQIKHGSVRKKATDNDDNDDDGFIVDDDAYGREKRRRNTTLHEIRKNRRHLKGILPTSFMTIYEKQLAEEENDKHRQSLIIPTKRKSGQDTEGHNNENADATATTTTRTVPAKRTSDASSSQSDFWEIEASALDDDNTTMVQHNSWSLGVPGHSRGTMDSRRYEEEQRSLLNENLPMDCGIPYLRCGAASLTKWTFMDDDKFSLFSLHQRHPSLPTEILDQPLVDADYVEISATISNLFESAYQTFNTMWTNFNVSGNDGSEKNTATIGYDLNEKNMNRCLEFLRFVSMLLAKGYQKNKNGTDGNDGNGISGASKIDKVVSAPKMQEYLIGKMNDLADRILDLVHWNDGELPRLKNAKTIHGPCSPLLLVLVYFVEWSYQIYKTSLINPLTMIFASASTHWTLETSIHRLLRYLLTLGPSSVSVEPITGLLFKVSESRVMETWVMVLQMLKFENMLDSVLWPSLQSFMDEMEKSNLLGNAGNTGSNDVTTWNKVELTWKWILNIASLQRIQKDDTGYGKVKTIEFSYNNGCGRVVQQLLREILEQQSTIGNISVTGKTHFQQFRSLTFVRLTLRRCHYLLTNYNWMWDSKTLQYLYNLAHIPLVQVFTGDPINPQQHLQQQDKVTAAKYFPSYFTNYVGTIPDYEIDSTDTCGTIFLKILSYGIRRRVEMVHKSESNCGNGGDSGVNVKTYNNEHHKNLQMCVARVLPSYLVAGDLTLGKSSSILLYSLVSNPASSFIQGNQINPLVTFAYDYSINMTILHATAPLGSDNNVGLDVPRCIFEFHTTLETERACASEITSEAHRIYENIKKKWHLN